MTTRNAAMTAVELAALGSATAAALVVWLLLARPLDVVDAVSGHELGGAGPPGLLDVPGPADAPPRTAVTETVMNDVDTCKGNVDTRKGNIVIGAMLVLTGLAIVLDRAGVFHWRDQWTLWPLILGGIGLARFLQSPPGEPKQGLLFLTAAVWLFLGEGGWVSLEDSWPIAVIAFGVIVALNGGTTACGGRWRICLADRRIRRKSDGGAITIVRCHRWPCSASGSRSSSPCRCPACDRSAQPMQIIACASCR